jgi:hypothetical protein
MDSFCGDYIAREIYLDGVSDAEIRWDYPGYCCVFSQPEHIRAGSDNL